MRFVSQYRLWACAGLLSVLGACGGGGGSAPIEAPTLLSAPQAQTVDDGSSASFSVNAAGGAPLSYQWQRNDSAIPGATTASYTTPALGLADDRALYRVLISNAAGTLLSPAVPVTVRPVAPSLQQPPQALSVADGELAVFSVTAKGSQPLSYRWLRNGLAIDGEQGSSLTLSPATLVDHGAQFSVRVANAAGEVSSAAVVLSVAAVAAQIVTQPQAQTVLDGETLRFEVLAKGSAPLQFQWLVDGVEIPGATGSSYALSADYAHNGKRFSVRVGNALATVTSETALLRVDPRAPSLSSAPRDVELAVGATARFSVVGAGTPPLQYRWERSDDTGLSWQAIDGASAASFELSAATLAWADTRMRVVVSNMAGSVASNPVALRLAPALRLLAGTPGGPGFADGQGQAARFTNPGGLLREADGSLLIGDRQNAVIRRVSPDGRVTTVAGRVGEHGYIDGPSDQARLNNPGALARDATGRVYVAESTVIRVIEVDGRVGTLAGAPSAYGSEDGQGSAARFSGVQDLLVDTDGQLLVLDSGINQTLRRVSPEGRVSTIAGLAGQLGSSNGKGDAVRFRYLSAMAMDAAGLLYIADENTIRRVDRTGEVSLYAGAPQSHGHNDGHRLQARFGYSSALGFDLEGRLYIASSGLMRRVDTDGSTITLAGGADNRGADRDGVGAAATLIQPTAMRLLADGSGFAFVDPWSHTVRRFGLNGAVSTLAGLGPQYQELDGPAAASRFGLLFGAAADAQGRVWINPGTLERGLPRLDPDGQVRRLLMGNPNIYNARAMIVDRAGDLLFADGNGQIVRIAAANGTLTLLAGSQTDGHGYRDGGYAQAQFRQPQGLAVDEQGRTYVADTYNNVIRRINGDGQVVTWAGLAGSCGHQDGSRELARFCYPGPMVFDAQGNLFVSDEGSHVVRRISPAGEVSTVAGTPFSPGMANGLVSRLQRPNALAFDGAGNLYIGDGGNALVRRLTPQGFVSTVMGQQGSRVLRPGQSLNFVSGLTLLPNGRLVVVSEHALVGD